MFFLLVVKCFEFPKALCKFPVIIIIIIIIAAVLAAVASFIIIFISKILNLLNIQLQCTYVQIQCPVSTLATEILIHVWSLYIAIRKQIYNNNK